MSENSLAMMPWFPRDFLSSTLGWRLLERSLYRSLLDAQWELESLPSDEEELALIAGATTAEFEGAWPRVKLKFACGEDGRLRNQKLEEHRTVALEQREKKRAAGRIGGQASVEARTKQRLSNRSTVAATVAQAEGQAEFNPPSPSPSPSPSEDKRKKAPPVGGGKESSRSARPAKRCPEDFQISEGMLAWGSRECPGLNVEAETAAFKDHEWRTGKTDWQAAWRNWMRRASTWKPNGAAQQRLTRFEQLFGTEDVVIVDGPSARNSA